MMPDQVTPTFLSREYLQTRRIDRISRSPCPVLSERQLPNLEFQIQGVDLLVDFPQIQCRKETD